MPLKAVGTKIHVRIDKKKQKKNTVLKSGIIVPPSAQHMIYNLQVAKIVSVGDGVTDPAIKVGRTAIIHHAVESEDQYLLETLPDGDEIRVVRVKSSIASYQLFGVFDEDGKIIAMGDFIFTEKQEREGETTEIIADMTGERLSYQVKREGSLYIPVMQKSLEEWELELRHFKVKVIAVNKKDPTIKVGDTIMVTAYSKYPITLNDVEYWIFQREFVEAILPKKRKPRTAKAAA